METGKQTNEVDASGNKWNEALKMELEDYKKKLTEANRKINETIILNKTLKIAKECKKNVMKQEEKKKKKKKK